MSKSAFQKVFDGNCKKELQRIEEAAMANAQLVSEQFLEHHEEIRNGKGCCDVIDPDEFVRELRDDTAQE